MNGFTKTTLSILALACGCALAQETTTPELATDNSISNDWNLKIGGTWRKFKDPKFKAAKSPAMSGAYLDGDNVIRPIEDVLDDIADEPISYVNVVTSTGGEAGGKGDYSFTESVGFIIGGSYTLSEENSLRLSLVANFQYFQLDSGRYAPYSGSSRVDQYAAVFGNMSDYPLQEDIGGLSFFTGTAKLDMDLDLYVFDLGVSLAYEFENSLSVSLAFGPTMSIADINSSSRLVGGAKDKDNDTEIEYGYYVSAAASYWFNERYGINAEVRYDDAFGTVGTRYVTQNLDGIGGNIALLMRF